MTEDGEYKWQRTDKEDAGKEHSVWCLGEAEGRTDQLKHTNGLGCGKTGSRCGAHGKYTGIRESEGVTLIQRVTQHFLFGGKTKLRKM